MVMQWDSWWKTRHLTQAALELDGPKRQVSYELGTETGAQSGDGATSSDPSQVKEHHWN